MKREWKSDKRSRSDESSKANSPFQVSRQFPFIHRRPDAVPNSLQVVEDFFGEELNDRLINVASKLSEVELKKLEDQLRSQNIRQQLILWQTRPIPTLETSLTRLKLIKDKNDRRQKQEFIEMFHSEYDYLSTTSEVYIHEQPLFEAATDISNLQTLKHLALYYQHVLVRDPISSERLSFETSATSPGQGVVSYKQRRNQLLDGLRQVLPIAKLIRSGCFVPFKEDSFTNSLQYRSLKNTKVPDPFLAWLLSTQPQLLELLKKEGSAETSWESLDGKILTDIQQVYPYDITTKQLKTTLKMADWSYRFSLIPTTSNPVIARHFEQCSRVMIDGEPDLSSVSVRNQSFRPAVAYSVPSLSHVSFDAIDQLRKNESVFHELRTAFLALSDECIKDHPDSYDAYKQVIRQRANDIIRPTYERLKTKRNKTLLKKLSFTAAGEGVGIGIDILAGIHGGGIIGGVAGHYASKPVEANFQDTKLACSILKSILLY